MNNHILESCGLAQRLIFYFTTLLGQGHFFLYIILFRHAEAGRIFYNTNMEMDPVSVSSFGVAGLLYVTLQLFVTAHILRYKDDVKSAIGWIGLVWLTPLVGSVIYVIFGINRIRRRALALRNQGPDLLKLTGKSVQEIEKEIPPSFLQLLRLGYKVHPQLFSFGNRAQAFVNGDSAYPEMCRLISGAKKEVLLQSYIFDNDKAGQLFLPALKQAVTNGAKVKVLVDGVGLTYSKPTIAAALRQIKGLEFAVFLKSKSPINLPFVNLRNHRKMLIVDGETAVFGGMNIAQGNLVATSPKEPIQDITFKVEGPVVDQMSRVFEEDWLFAGKKHFIPASFHAQGTLPGKMPARIIPDGPDSDFGKIELMVLGALSCAQKSVSILTPYFLPENDILMALEVAAMRGVKVEIILPSKSNIFGMDFAMRANFARLLKKGVRIYRTKPPFDHSKVMLVDGAWLFVGSANWDVRSFKLNFECNLECVDTELAQEVGAIIAHKKEGARLEKLEKHPAFWRLVLCNAFKLLTPYY